MSELTKLRCFNPSTGKHDGGYCVWEGKGKCMKCEAADEIERLRAELNTLAEGNVERWERECAYAAEIERLREQVVNLQTRNNALYEAIDILKRGGKLK